MKYRMEWLLCLGVFCAGVIWSKLIFPIGFYTVANIHDLFEIFGSAATTVAVVFAWLTMNSWRKQAKAESDHELARRVVLVLRKYRDELVRTWSYAESSVAQISGNTWIGEGGSDNPLFGLYRQRLEEIAAVRAELAPIELECSEIWGGVFKTQFAELYSYDDGFCSFIETYLGLLISGRFDDRSEMESDGAVERWKQMPSWGLGDHKSAEATIEKLVEPLKSKARARLIGFNE